MRAAVLLRIRKPLLERLDDFVDTHGGVRMATIVKFIEDGLARAELAASLERLQGGKAMRRDLIAEGAAIRYDYEEYRAQQVADHARGETIMDDKLLEQRLDSAAAQLGLRYDEKLLTGSYRFSRISDGAWFVFQAADLRGLANVTALLAARPDAMSVAEYVAGKTAPQLDELTTIRQSGTMDDEIRRPRQTYTEDGLMKEQTAAPGRIMPGDFRFVPQDPFETRLRDVIRAISEAEKAATSDEVEGHLAHARAAVGAALAGAIRWAT